MVEMRDDTQSESMEPPMSQAEKDEAYKKFEDIIYSNLEEILEKRPNFPVSRFAKAILEDVDLDEQGEPLETKKKKKDKKKKDKKKKDKKEKKDKKDKDSDKSGDESDASDKSDDSSKKKKKDKKDKKDKKEKKEKKKAASEDSDKSDDWRASNKTVSAHCNLSILMQSYKL